LIFGFAENQPPPPGVNLMNSVIASKAKQSFFKKYVSLDNRDFKTISNLYFINHEAAIMCHIEPVEMQQMVLYGQTIKL